MRLKTAASFVASTMGAGLLAGALIPGPAGATVTPTSTTPAVQTVTSAGFLAGCCWRRRCCRCGGGCGWRGGGWRGGGWRGGWRGGGGWRWNNWDGGWGDDWWW
ncbi:hypothetical protein AB0395_05125 [Streptosporangium sp. NPDC051023]|uniref:hypothetical protein n=1 Tax=Streptosporangium sp. NPDC051023 TaxID=3155410 RepID=UPI00344EBE28